MDTRRDHDDVAPPTLHRALAHWAAVQPEAPFVVEAETGRTLTYGACYQGVCGLRHYLGHERRTVLVALPGGIETALIWLATLTGGHRIVPCAPDAPAAEYAALARRWGPDYVVAEQASHNAAVAAPGAEVLARKELPEAAARWVPGGGGDCPPPAREGELLLTTSGTTGEPKGVRLEARRLAWTAEQIRIAHRLTRADRGLAVLPFFHVNAPVVSLCATLRAGGAVVIASHFSRRRFWSWIARERVTWASVVPTVLALLLQTDEPADVSESLRFVRTAAAPLPVPHLRAFERRFGVPVVETYGLTEAASTVTANPVPPGQRKPGSVGLPLGVDLRICAPAVDSGPLPLVDVAAGDEGEICVRGPSVIGEYEGGADDAAFVEGWFRTGDLGRRDADGYVYLSGRLHDVINRGGHKIAPREVEEALLAHPAVRDVAVVGLPDPLYGQRVVAYVVAREDTVSGHEMVDALRQHCAGRLSAHKVPSEFLAVESLPRTRLGKMRRRALSTDVGPAGRVEVHCCATT